MTSDFTELAATSQEILHEVEKAVIGKRDVLEKILAAFLTPGGHVLI